MKNILILLLASAMLCAACKKSKDPDVQPPPVVTPEPVLGNPEMDYITFADLSVGAGQEVYIDVDKDGRKDLIFKTELISYDGNTKTKIAFKAESGIYCRMAVDTNTEAIPRLIHKQPLTKADLPSYSWLPVLSLTLMEQITSNQPATWQGKYATTTPSYFPFQIIKSGITRLGWLEITAELNTRRLVFHRAGISKEAADKVYAGL